MKVTASLPTGVAAIFFEEARQRRRLETLLVDRLEAAGFGEVVLPVLDYLDPYEQMLSGRSRSELYRFIDRDGALLSLRADFTPLLARLISPRLASLDLPLRLFYRGDVLRYQEARAGRERELFQVGAELLGLPGEEAERAALDRFIDLLMAATDQPLRVVVGFAGALDALLLAHAGADGAGQLVASVGRRERQAVRGVPPLLDVVASGVPTDVGALGNAAAERLTRVQAMIAELAERYPGVSLEIDLAEFADQALDPALGKWVGPRAYYDGLVFRAFAGSAGLPVGSGGRYDGLFQALGGDGITAAGFSIGVDRLALGPRCQAPGAQGVDGSRSES
jgi:ATP phosphoribosyltransferase regulatory subunit